MFILAHGAGRARAVAGGGRGGAQVRAVYEVCRGMLDGGVKRPLGETLAAVHAAELALASELSCADAKGGSVPVRARARVRRFTL